jgi:CheY-like chemotaxis protein
MPGRYDRASSVRSDVQHSIEGVCSLAVLLFLRARNAGYKGLAPSALAASVVVQDRTVMSAASRTRVLIADDHRLVAEAYRSLLLEEEYEVVGIVHDGRALLDAASQLQPDLILLDIAIPGLNGLAAGAQVKTQWPEVELVFVSTTLSPGVVAEAFHRGASAYVCKSAAARELLTALEAVRAGRVYLSRWSPKTPWPICSGRPTAGRRTTPDTTPAGGLTPVGQRPDATGSGAGAFSPAGDDSLAPTSHHAPFRREA